MTTYSPVQLARLLGYTDEARPGLVVRNYLRSKYPEHEKNARWELDESEAADVIANVPRRNEVRASTHPWLEVPWDRLEPVGALAIAAGRIEAQSTITLRALLRPVDRGTARAITNTPSFSVTMRMISEILDVSVVGEVDASLRGDWKAWKKKATGFMNRRNALVHSMWALGEGAPKSISLSRGTHSEAPDAGELTIQALEGMNIARDGYFAGRIAAAIRSDQYQAAVVSMSDREGWLFLG